jgi:hypothetical protein
MPASNLPRSVKGETLPECRDELAEEKEVLEKRVSEDCRKRLCSIFFESCGLY